MELDIPKEITACMHQGKYTLVEEIFSGGTDTKKFLCLDQKNQKRVLKFGEKVQREIGGYKLFSEQLHDHIPLFQREGDILITRFVVGERLDKILQELPSDGSKILESLFSKIRPFYESNVEDKDYNFFPEIKEKLDSSFHKLYNIDLGLIHRKIDINGVLFPSLSDQLSFINSNFEKYGVGTKGLIHGDLQPSNIIVDNNSFTIIDFSNFGYNDICLDISKLLSYSIVPFRFQLFRDKVSPFPEIKMEIGEYVSIDYKILYPQAEVYNYILQKDILKLGSSLHDDFFQLRALLYTWYHQFITIPRHFKYSETIPMIICNCCKTYANCLHTFSS